MGRIPERELGELRSLLRTITRGLWRRHGPRLGAHVGRRHAAVVTLVAEGERTVGEIAEALGISLPAASKLSRELEDAGLVQRREDEDDRRRTVVSIAPEARPGIGAWLEERNRPLERALAALDAGERAAFLKGLRALAGAVLEESACHGALGPHDRPPRRRRPHRHRPL
jgi:DNA-binding MarR family transcriptional regulator